jgi:EAL domain-containing protein (putative c-di-GMP-specific phosphodiesterase class I)
MSEKKFLKSLNLAFSSLTRTSPEKSSKIAGGLICVLIDHWQDLREQFGYDGLFALRAQIMSLVKPVLGDNPSLMILSESGLVALVPCSDNRSLSEVGDTLFRLIADHEFSLKDDSIALTVSLSFCPFDFRFADAARMLVEAVRQAEGLREKGGNGQVEVWAKITASQASNDDQQMLRRLMQALRSDSVRVVFQPLLPTRGDSMRSYQMLPRLQTHDGELLAAAMWLPLAKAANLVSTLDRWMLTRAIHLVDKRFRNQQLRLFISQSGERLANREARQKLVRQLKSASDLGGRLVLDFKLTDAMAHLKGAEEIIKLSKRQGFGICLSMIDDHSNWELLTGRLRCEYLRMAPNLARNLVSSDQLETDLGQMTAPARKLGVRVIMPMIEDADTAAYLWRSDVDYLQGNMIQAAEETLRFAD